MSIARGGQKDRPAQANDGAGPAICRVQVVDVFRLVWRQVAGHVGVPGAVSLWLACLLLGRWLAARPAPSTALP